MLKNNLFESNNPNLKTSFDYLGMLREGSNDLNRYYFSKNTKPRINNRTDDIFNHTISTGGYNSDGSTIIKGYKISANTKGGIVPLPPLKQNQWTGDEISNHPVPIRNALINPIYAERRIIDKPKSNKIHPMSVH